MSLSELILNITLTLKDHVDNKIIDENTMISILKNTLNKTSLNKDVIKDNINNNSGNKLECFIFNNDLSKIPIEKGIGFYHQNNVKRDVVTVLKKPSWCDVYSSDDDECKIVVKKQQQPVKRVNITNTVDNNRKTISYLRNCEKTLNFFIETYKINHYDSAKTVKELNITIIRLLGVNLNNPNPRAYENTCWFIRNLKCNFGEHCQANEVNMCTYAHPKSKKKQYCCINEYDYDVWDTTYFRCLKSETFSNNEEYFSNKYNLEDVIPLSEFINVNKAIINWYFNVYNNIKSYD